MFLPVWADGATAGAVYLLELETPPAAALVSGDGAKATGAATRARVQAIAAEQGAVLRALQVKAAGGAEVLFATQRVFNGIAVRVAPEHWADLTVLPGVRSARRMRPVRLSTESSVSFLGAPEVWSEMGFPITGAGVSIGIIDTGIDYFHPVFGGTPSQKRGHNPLVIGEPGFPSAKIAGGYDFVGDAYDPEDPAHATPVPDPDPIDQNGHGTHVAGIAAGFGMDFNGDTYTGPYTAAAGLGALRIGPGVAPEATLYALKVFGAGRSSFHVLPAIEWATDPNGDGDFSDRLDVLNLSIGDTFGDVESPEAVAVENAAAAGVVVVASAGNQGDVYFIMGKPGVVPSVISVAASEDDDPEFPADFAPDRLASFTSRGPAALGTGVLAKPDVTAPGRNIRSANLVNTSRLGDVDALASIKSGTSMSAPHVAGLAALLRQLHPDWEPAAIKAVLVNTANHDLFLRQGEPLPRLAVSRVGSGRVDAVLAAESGVIAYDLDHPERVGLTFDTRYVTGSVVERKTLRIENRGSATVTYRLALDVTTGMAGLDRFLEPTQVGPIGPGESADVTFAIQTGVTRLHHPRDPALRTGVNEFTRHWLNEFSGYVTLSPEGGAVIPLRVPFYAAPQPTAAMAGAASIDVRHGEVSLPLGGRSLVSGTNFPFDFRAITVPFELLAVSPDEPESEGLANGGDLRFIGVTTNFPHVDAGDEDEEAPTVWFGLATWQPWVSLNAIRFEIDIDTDRDGAFDYMLYATSAVSDNTPNSTFVSDVFVTRLSDLGENVPIQGFVNQYAAETYDTAVFDNNVAVLPVTVEGLGLSESNSRFDFRVRTIDDNALPGEGPVDQSPTLTYDIARPAIDFSGGSPDYPGVFPDETDSIPVAYDGEAYEGNRLGILLFHHHNAPGMRAQWIGVVTPGDTDEDGIPDGDEGGGDADGDGIPNVADLDADGNGIDDVTEGTGDIDFDSIPDFLDPDNDGDFLDDIDELSPPQTDLNDYDTDGDGIRDGIEGKGDFDHDGVINALDDDSDGDGIGDAVEGMADPDNDGAYNFLDIDSDGDGIGDVVEGVMDSDDDTVPDYLDLDSDGDGIDDAVETVLDSDGDDIPNYLDRDSDGDDIDDLVEGTGDPDGDTVPNFLDKDSDDDHIPDAEEARIGTSPYLADTDGDGRSDPDEIAQGTDPRVADAPEMADGVIASDGTFADFVRITWEMARGADAYRVLRARAGTPEEEAPVSEWLAADTLEFDDTTALAPVRSAPEGCEAPEPLFTAYAYRVEARNAGGLSAPSMPDAGYRGLDTPYLPAPPSPPSGVQATDGTETQFVRVTWAAGACVDEYRVYRGVGLTIDDILPVSPWLSADTLSFDDTSAEPAGHEEVAGCEAPMPVFTVYTYWVRARNAGGVTPFAAPDTGFRGPEEALLPDAPPAPSGVAATDGTDAALVRVTWDAVACADAYRVYRSDGGDAGSALPVSDWLTGDTLSFEDTTATPATLTTPGGCAEPQPVFTIHTYWVRARNAGGESPLSTPNTGYRGLASTVAAGLTLFVVLALAAGRRRRSWPNGRAGHSRRARRPDRGVPRCFGGLR